MIKIQPLLLSFALSALLFSCGKPQKVQDAEKIVSVFFKALRNDDSATLKLVYPDFHKLPSWYKSDSFEFLDYDRKKGVVEILVKNRFTNKKNKTFEQRITLMVSEDESNMHIVDSKGMCDFTEQDIYKFGTGTGCVSRDTTQSDQTTVKQLERAGELLVIEAKDLIQELRDSVPLADVKTSNLFGYISGSARLINNSPYPLYLVRYEVALSDKAGNVLKTEDGFAAVDSVASGQDKPFSFFIEPPEGATNLDVRLKYDNMFLIDCLSSKTWTGKECDQLKNK